MPSSPVSAAASSTNYDKLMGSKWGDRDSLVTIHFDSNLVTSTGTMLDKTVEEGMESTLPANQFADSTLQSLFHHWNTSADDAGTSYDDLASVPAGDLPSAPSTLTLYAMWLGIAISNWTASMTGDVITYTFEATNTGTMDLANVSLDVSGFDGVAGALDTMTCDNGTLAPGDTATCTATYTVQDGDRGNTVGFTAFVTGDASGNSGALSDKVAASYDVPAASVPGTSPGSTGTGARVASVTVTPNPVSVAVGSTVSLKATLLPAIVGDRPLTWTSSDPSIATVDPKTGVVTGVSPGTVTITAKALDGVSGSAVVTVVPAGASTSIVVNPTTKTLTVGDSFTPVATVLPADTADKTVTWSSSDPTIATVDPKTGVVTAVSVGTVTITATTVDGKTATCVVTVVPRVGPPEELSAALVNTTSSLSGGDAAWSNGSDPETITVSLHDGDGNLVPIDCTTLTSSAPTWVKVGAFTPNPDGTCSAKVTSTKPGIFPVTVLQNGKQVGLPLDTHFIAIIPPVKQGADGSWSVSAAGFWPGELVDAWVHSNPLQVGNGLVADKDGNVAVTFTLPNGFPTGDHVVYFVGRQSGTTNTAPFTIKPAQTVPTGSSTIVQAGGSETSAGTVAGTFAVVFVVLGGALLLWRRRMVTSF